MAMGRKFATCLLLTGLVGCGPVGSAPLAPRSGAPGPPPGPTTTIIGPDNNRISCTDYSGAVCPQP